MSLGKIQFKAKSGLNKARLFDEDEDEGPSLPPPKRRLVELDNEPDASSNALNQFESDDEPVGDLDGDEKGVKKVMQMFVRPSNDEGRASEYVPGSRGYARPIRGFEDDLDEDNGLNQLNEEKKDSEGEEDDPLESFMANIDKEVKDETKSSKRKPLEERFEAEDEVESYVKFMAERGLEVGKGRPGDEVSPDDIDSDEEVYKTAARIDALAESNNGDEPTNTSKKEIDPLPPINHDLIAYLEIAKDFYEEHEEISALSEDRVRELRKELGIRVSGSEPPRPALSFAHMNFDDALIRTIAKHGYTEPTVIQKQAVPVALAGRDIIGIAQTGSGKTAAFLWPMLVHLMDQPDLSKGEGPIGLVLAPTRELAQQIYSEAKKFAKAYDVEVGLVYGGGNKGEQIKELRRGVHVLVATPGRLIDLVRAKATNLTRVSYLVLDEADRMFDLGFEPQVRSISSHIRPDRQTLLFSATFPPRIESLARDILTDPIRIAIGNTHASNSDIVQRVEVLEDTMKWGWLTARLATFVQEGQVIVFIGRKSGVDELTANLKASGFEAKALHGDLMQHERDTVINDFKKGRFGILVATDVVGRGLDIPSVRNVVNYDVPKDIDSHVHRIGRTGRAGVMGRAWTLVNPKEDFFAGLLVRNLEESGQEVPGVLMALARKNPRFGGGGFRGRGGRGRGGRGRGSDRGRGRGGIGMSEPRGGFHSDSGQSSQWKPEQRHADMLGGRVGSSGSGSAGPSRFQGMSFAKASTSEGSK